ncbi:hypothetical protein B9Z65_1239 [Elsinoe australis]|uniref:Myb-like domain-containing protein n=1 Tax=Elsinoe australis TaxID=40998 RepID=A0A2P7YPZ8_9PEZI|nr:hypothetical protein B9Z65_1239 [Elsinoe australis]
MYPNPRTRQPGMSPIRTDNPNLEPRNTYTTMHNAPTHISQIQQTYPPVYPRFIPFGFGQGVFNKHPLTAPSAPTMPFTPATEAEGFFNQRYPSIDDGLTSGSSSSGSSDYSEPTLKEESVSPRTLTAYPSPTYQQPLIWSSMGTACFLTPHIPNEYTMTHHTFFPQKTWEPTPTWQSDGPIQEHINIDTWSDSYRHECPEPQPPNFNFANVASNPYIREPSVFSVHLEDPVKSSIEAAAPSIMLKPRALQPRVVEPQVIEPDQSIIDLPTPTSATPCSPSAASEIVLQFPKPVSQAFSAHPSNEQDNNKDIDTSDATANDANSTLSKKTKTTMRRINHGPITTSERKRRNDVLLRLRKQGYTYKECRELGDFAENESTLRGRMRILSRPEVARKRKPGWSGEDVRLLEKIVNEKFNTALATGQPKAIKSHRGKRDNTLYFKVPWAEVAVELHERGAKYPFGSGSCSKKWRELHRCAVAV